MKQPDRINASLLIPCYNAEKYLIRLKAQVEALDPKFNQVVLVDDGSTDNTLAVAKQLGLVIHPLVTNRGPGGARNALLQTATQEWIHFLDADDEIAPDYLERVRPFARNDVDVVLSGCEFVGAEDRKHWILWTYDDEAFQQDALSEAIVHPVFLHCSLIRRSKALEAGGFDEKLRCYEDGDFHVRLAAAGARFRCMPDVLATSLRHFQGSGGNELYCEKCRLEFLKKYLGFSGRVPARVLANALAQCAGRLHRNREFLGSREAFAMAFQLGWKGPETKNPLLQALALFPNKKTKQLLYLIQEGFRTGWPARPGKVATS